MSMLKNSEKQPRKCYYAMCKSNSSNTKVFAFPVRDETRTKAWVHATGNKKLRNLDNNQLKRRYVCSKHFMDGHFMDAKYKLRLTPAAVPYRYDDTSGTPGSSHSVMESRDPLRVTDVCPPEVAPHIKQKFDVGPTVLQPTDHLDMMVEPKLEQIKEEPLEVESDSPCVADVCSPSATLAVKQEIEVGPTVLQPIGGLYMKVKPKLEQIKEEISQSTDIKDMQYSGPMCNEATTSTIIMVGSRVTIPIEFEAKQEHQANEILPNTNESDAMQNGRSHYQCDVCKKIFTLKTTLITHMLIHIGTVYKHDCVICLKSYTRKSYLNQHMAIHTGNRAYKCDICLKSFIYKNILKEHKHIHTGLRPHKCDICCMSFTQKTNLNEHKKIHTDLRSYKCKICSKSYRQKSSLSKHTYTAHIGLSHKCDICSKAFTRKDTLNKHKNIHTGLCLYKCDVCLKSFTHKHSLNQHQKVHTNLRPYECDVCSKSFRQKSNLTTHIAIHFGFSYKCDICSKSFTNKDYINVHKKTHLRPYKCAICFKSYKQKSCLIMHKKIMHTDVFPYKCAFCLKIYKHKISLNKHMASVHSHKK